jgi:hypothetical protein
MRVSVSADPGAPETAFEAEVPSARDPELIYRVSRLADGTWMCSCRGFRYQARSDGLCRHIDGEQERRARAGTLAFLLG